jgi:two-component system, OmpR family, sensor kinase
MKREDQRPGQGSGDAVLHADEDRKMFEEIAALNNDLVTMQRELARRNAELTRVAEQKNQLLGVAAHDLRNPLAVIYSSSDFLLSEQRNFDADQIEMMSAIKTSSLYMLQLIEDILRICP